MKGSLRIVGQFTKVTPHLLRVSQICMNPPPHAVFITKCSFIVSSFHDSTLALSWACTIIVPCLQLPNILHKKKKKKNGNRLGKIIAT